MSIKELSSDEIDALVGTRHPVTGVEYPSNGLQPYYYWLMRALHLISESTIGALRVAAEDTSAPTVRVAPGRASLSSVVLDYPGEVIDLSGFNNDTAYVWLYNDSGSVAVGVASDAAGWPVGTHLKLAEVVIAAGEISEIIDRRIDHLFSV